MDIARLSTIDLIKPRINAKISIWSWKNAVLRTLEHLGYLQIDALSIVERAHHHTLWTRVKNYKTHYLEELIAERKVFEYWFHAASFISMKDYRYF